MAKQSPALLCAPNRAESYPPQLSCLSLEKRAQAPRWSPHHPTSQLPVDTRRLLPAACPCLRSRCRELCAATNSWGPAAALSYLIQSGPGNPEADDRLLILSSPH